MHTMRTNGVALLLTALLAAGCGGSASSPTQGASSAAPTEAPASADAGNGGTESEAPEASADSGGGSGGGGTGDDAVALGGQLVPPNSQEVSKTTTATYWYVIYQSTDSPETLKSFYEAQIPKTGMQIISTTSASDGYVWVIAADESGSFGGAVTVAPGDGGSGSSVIVAVGS